MFTNQHRTSVTISNVVGASTAQQPQALADVIVTYLGAGEQPLLPRGPRQKPRPAARGLIERYRPLR